MIGSGLFAPTPIRSPAGHALTYEETERRLAPVLDRVPITRVYDATALDWLGLPVWSAVTPLALDLTVHAGKGLTAAAARVSAVMEAIERVCAERVEDERIRVATFAELRREGERVLDPELFDLPFETRYRRDRPLAWVRGHDLIAGHDAWVALDLVLSPSREGICRGVETNGLAAGNNRTEAVLHGLHELVERDALAHDRFTRLYADDGQRARVRVVAPDSLPDDAAAWVRVLEDLGLPTVIRDLSHELRVPVFRATIYDSSFPGREGLATTFAGLGADLDPAHAVSRAICEAVQSHTVMVLGARDAVEDGGAPMRNDKRSFLRRLTTPTSVQPFPDGAGELPDDLAARLWILVQRVAAAGLDHCVVVDLTREDLGIPVVRVLVPGLAGPFGETSRRPGLRLLRTLAATERASHPPALVARRAGDEADARRAGGEADARRAGGEGDARRAGGEGEPVMRKPALSGLTHHDPPGAPPNAGPKDPPLPREAGRTPDGARATGLYVFVGPSLERDAVAAALPHARLEPPIARGDLVRLQRGATTFLIIDGAFAHRLAIAPSEIVDAIAAGARVLGAASMGAVRAAECHPAGMEGVGAVYRLYRLGVLRDDDEVAVATDPERGCAAVSVALVNVRFAMLAGLRAGLLDREQAAAVLAAARRTHFADRRWPTIFDRAGLGPGDELRALCERTDVKRRDAIRAVAHLAEQGQAPGTASKTSGEVPGRLPRYPGHDPLLGHSWSGLRRELASWLLETGRYRRYFDEAAVAAADRAGWEARVWAKLEAEGAREHELMHWYAVRRLSAYP